MTARMLPVALAVSSICAGTANAQVADDRLEEIIVSAQKREEDLQDVPVTINFVSGDLMRQQGIETLKDINQLVPGISIRENNDPRNVGFLIRGIGSNQSFIGIEPSAAVIVDGEVMARNSSLFGDIHDVESVSVLKGPQGTLFGKNSVAGAMVVRTKRPSLDDSDGNVRLSLSEAGDGMEYHLSATKNWALSDHSALRINAFTGENDGWVENVMNGPNGGSSDSAGVRVQYLNQVNDKLDVLFRAEAAQRNLGPGIRVFIVRDDFDVPQSEIDNLLASGVTQQEIDLWRTTNLHRLSNTPFGEWNDKTSALNNRDYGWIDTAGASVEANYQLDAGHVVTFTSHYRNSDLLTNDSITGTAVDAFPLYFSGPVESDLFQNELRIASPTGGRVDYVGGLYFLHSKVTRNQKALACQDPGLMNSIVDADLEVTKCGNDVVDAAGDFYTTEFGYNEATGELIGYSGLSTQIWNREYKNNDLITNNAAVFGQLDFHMTDNLTLVLGGRLLYEHQDFSIDIREDGLVNTDIRPRILWLLDENGNRRALDGLFGGGTIFPTNPDFGNITNNPATDTDRGNPANKFVTAQAESRDTAFIYKLALKWDATDNLMFYTSYSTGYKGVGWFSDSNVGQFNLDNDYPIPPEESANFEIGLRSEWFDGKLRFNLTYFDTEFEHYQDRLKLLDFDLYPIVDGGLVAYDPVTNPTGSGQPVQKFDIVDAGTLESTGYDVELNWLVTDWLNLNVGYSHVEATFGDTDVLIPCNAAAGNSGEAVTCLPAINYGEFWDYTFGRFGQFFELDGAQLANAPEDTVTADAVVDFSLGRWNSYVRWNYRYKSEEFTNHGGRFNNNSAATMEAVGIHNLFVGLTSPSGKYRFTAFVKNLFDEHYYARKTNFGDGLAENLVGRYPLVTSPEFAAAGVPGAYGYPGLFFRVAPEHGNVPRDFNRYVGVTFEMSFQ